jgi:hypothetical protein
MYLVQFEITYGIHPIYFSAKNNKEAIAMVSRGFHRWTGYRTGRLYKWGRIGRRDKLIAIIRRKSDMRIEIIT